MVMFVNNLPEGTSEEELRDVVEQYIEVVDILILVDIYTRTIRADGFVVITKKIEGCLHMMNFVLNGQKLKFSNATIIVQDFQYKKTLKKECRPSVSQWVVDIRPGHIHYHIPHPSEDPFDFVPPEQSPTAHRLDDVLMIIFEMLNVPQMLRIERTCRRWQRLIRYILSNCLVINFSVRETIWGSVNNLTTESRGRPFFGQSLLHKVIILNFNTLEHLIVYNLKVDMRNSTKAIIQNCTHMAHISVVFENTVEV